MLQLTERHKELLHRADKDDGATFEQLGCDYLFVDEAHHAKNLAISTRMPALGKAGSGYASQLDIRLQWLRRQYGAKVVTLSTATPIANSLSEMWVMQHYAAPDTLAAAGVAHFDAWASNFAAQVTRLELAPEGTHYRIATRLAKFRNVPDLIRMFSVFADVRTKADLNLPVPALRDGRAEVVVVPGSDDLADYVATLGDRAEQVRSRIVTPEEDNMLKISSDGRAAALDVRLVGLDAPLGATKLTVAADRIHTIWAANRERRYLDPAGEQHPRPGALQLVFAELGTPGGARWGVYDELRRLLAERGRARRDRCGSCTRPATPARRSSCSPPAATGPSPCSSAPPTRWGSAPTCRPAASPSTTSTARGDRPTSNNAKAASCDRATRTRSSTSSATSPPAASTSTCGWLTEREGPPRRRVGLERWRLGAVEGGDRRGHRA